jgi:hypothetical protein
VGVSWPRSLLGTFVPRLATGLPDHAAQDLLLLLGLLIGGDVASGTLLCHVLKLASCHVRVVKFAFDLVTQHLGDSHQPADWSQRKSEK